VLAGPFVAVNVPLKLAPNAPVAIRHTRSAVKKAFVINPRSQLLIFVIHGLRAEMLNRFRNRLAC
jgi:hypothetical protein